MLQNDIHSLKPSRYDQYKNHQFRLPLDRLAESYLDAEEAAIRGDFSWITRFAADNVELSAVALMLMGNNAGASSRFASASPMTARAKFFGALNDWIMTGEPRPLADRIAEIATPDSRSKLSAFCDTDEKRELQVLFVGGPTSRIESLIPSFEGVWAAIGEADAETGGIKPKALRSEPPPRGSLFSYDVIFVDPSHWLPMGLEAYDGIKIGFIGDFEWNFAHLPERYKIFDALVSLGSQGNIEARARYSRPSFVGPIAVHIGLLNVDKAFLNRDTCQTAWSELNRPIDIVSTGRQKHLSGLYYDKPVFNRALMSLQKDCRLELLNQMLPEEEYRQKMARAKFVASSHRYGLGQSWRVFESLGVGSMALVDSASGALSRFSQDFGAIHTVRSGNMIGDMEHHVNQHMNYQETFLPKSDEFFRELHSVVAPVKHGVAKEMRTLIVLSHIARHGFPNATLDDWRNDPDLQQYAEVRSGTGAGANVRKPIIQSHFVASLLKPWVAKQTSPDPKQASYFHAMDDLALLHVQHAMEIQDADAILSQTLRVKDAFPDHGMPLFLTAAALRLQNKPARADNILSNLIEKFESLQFDIADARPEWRLGQLSVGALVDSGMRDALDAALDSYSVPPKSSSLTKQLPKFRNMIKSLSFTMIADNALRMGNQRRAADYALIAIERDIWNVTAGGVLLQALRQLNPISAQAQSAEEFLYFFGEIGSRNQDLFYMFAWTAMRLLIEQKQKSEAEELAHNWLLSWKRNGRPAPTTAIPAWSRDEATEVIKDSTMRSILESLAFNPSDAN